MGGVDAPDGALTPVVVSVWSLTLRGQPGPRPWGLPGMKGEICRGGDMGTWSPLPLHCCLEGVISLETENLPSSLVGVVLGGNKVMRIFESWILKNDLF